MQREEKIKLYLDRSAEFGQEEAKEERTLLLLSVLRLFIFAGGLVVTWFGFERGNTTGIIVMVLAIASFLSVLKLFSKHTKRKNYIANLVLINKNEEKALSGDLSAFEAGECYKDIHHDFSNDIDLFGTDSLFQHINRTISEYGRDTLAEWLSDPYILSADLGERQSAVKELAGKLKWRHEFMASGMKVPLDRKSISGLIRWLNEKNDISSSVIARFLIVFLPVAALTTFILAAADILSYQFFIMVFLLNLFYISIGLKKSNRIHDSLTRKHEYLASMFDMLRSFGSESFTTASLNNIKASLADDEMSAAASVRSLGDLIQALDSRINLFAGIILNGLLLWDYQCIYRLEKWKKKYRDLFPSWLDMIGRADAFISLGNYAFNNEDFIYPAVSAGSPLFSAKNLGHQLISEEKRVCNDFTLDRRGTICIISGANMSGKSTFLRTVAINYILAMAGAPVCATEMSFVPVKLFTSMRTTDSLSDNESYFYAELKRLKILLDRIMTGEPVFMILDEILKGTNSEDKSSGSLLFMRKILRNGGTGLIATHDISLGTLEEEEPDKIMNKSFEIEIDGEAIIFDYKLHEGITKKMNAVFLMRQMGIL